RAAMMQLVAAILGSPRVGLDVDQIADAIWLSQFMTGDECGRSVVPSAVEPRPEPAPRPEPDPPGHDQPTPPTVPGIPPGDPGPARPRADIERPPAAGGPVRGAARSRSPAPAALTRQLGPARPPRPPAGRPPRPDAGRVVEDVTADRIARTGLWLA